MVVEPFWFPMSWCWYLGQCHFSTWRSFWDNTIGRDLSAYGEYVQYSKVFKDLMKHRDTRDKFHWHWYYYEVFYINSAHYSILGVGYCAVFIAFYVSFYYNVIIGWSLYYAANSLTFTLPWTNCNNTWNTEYCTLRCDNDNSSKFNCNETRSPAKEYFK